MAAAWKDGGKGSYIIDRRVPGIGRFKMATGAETRPEYRALSDMVTGLIAAGRIDILRGIAAGKFTFQAVLRHWQSQTLAELPTGQTLEPLGKALERFRLAHDVAETTRRDMATSFRAVVKAAPQGATIADLPQVLRSMKAVMREKRTPIAFNRARAYCLAFSRDHSGQYGPLWTEVARVDAFNAKQRARLAKPPQLQRRPLTVEEFDRVLLAFEDMPVYHGKRGGGKALRRTIAQGGFIIMAKILATTGLRPQEYWSRDGASWDRQVGFLRVRGTKTRAANRVTPAIVATLAPLTSEQTFRAAFAKATEKALGVALDTYSLRRTFASWCELAQLPESRRKAYLGHGKKDVTDIYLQTDVVPFVGGDAAILTAWIATEREKAKKARFSVVSHDSFHGSE